MGTQARLVSALRARPPPERCAWQEAECSRGQRRIEYFFGQASRTERLEETAEEGATMPSDAALPSVSVSAVTLLDAASSPRPSMTPNLSRWGPEADPWMCLE